MNAKPQTKKRRTTNKSIQIFLGALILVNLVGFMTFALVQNHHQSEFNRFQSEINQKNQLFERIHRQLGFGEMIHSFKNLVIRGEQDYRTQSYSQSVQDNIDQILTAIRTYRRFDPLSEAEKAGLNGVEEVVRNYQKMLPRVTALQGKGIGISEIDRQVVVDDRPAGLGHFGVDGV